MKNSLFVICFGLLLAGCNSSISTPSPVQLSAAPMNVNLGWRSTSGAQLGFYIEASTDGKNFAQVLTIPDGVDNARIAVQSGSTYYFRMRSFNSVGTSNYTPVVTVT